MTAVYVLAAAWKRYREYQVADNTYMSRAMTEARASWYRR